VLRWTGIKITVWRKLVLFDKRDAFSLAIAAWIKKRGDRLKTFPMVSAEP